MVAPGAPALERKRKPKKDKDKPSDDRIVVIVLKGSPEYKAWLAGLSESTLIPMSSMVRDAMRRWAKDRGLPEGPDR